MIEPVAGSHECSNKNKAWSVPLCCCSVARLWYCMYKSMDTVEIASARYQIRGFTGDFKKKNEKNPGSKVTVSVVCMTRPSRIFIV